MNKLSRSTSTKASDKKNTSEIPNESNLLELENLKNNLEQYCSNRGNSLHRDENDVVDPMNIEADNANGNDFAMSEETSRNNNEMDDDTGNADATDDNEGDIEENIRIEENQDNIGKLLFNELTVHLLVSKGICIYCENFVRSSDFLKHLALCEDNQESLPNIIGNDEVVKENANSVN